MEGITVRLAERGEVAACLALLPYVKGEYNEILIALHGDALAGAAAVSWQSWMQPGGFPLAVEVMPDLRGRGVGRLLIQAAKEISFGETDGLWSFHAIAPDSPEGRFLKACDFRPLRVQRHFLAKVDLLAEHISPLVARLRQADRIPPDASVIPLSEAPAEEIGWLLSQTLGGGPADMRLRLTRKGITSTYGRSLAAMQGGDVAGVIVCRVLNGIGVIDAWATASNRRGAWATPLMLETIARNGRADGYEDFRFYCDETTAPTMKLARRIKATEIAIDAFFYYAASDS